MAMQMISTGEDQTAEECLLLHGPPFVGKTTYCLSLMKENYTKVSPQELLKDNPTLNLRQLIHQHIIRSMSQGINVVVDDSAQTSAMRKSYTRLLASKLPNALISCHSLHPEHGLQQLQWQKEFSIASAFKLKDWDSARSIWSIDIHQWYQKSDEVSEHEGFTSIIEKSTQLHVSSSFAPLVPCLILDWPCAVNNKLKELLMFWIRFNPVGRVIAFAHSTNCSSVGNNSSEFTGMTADIDHLTSMVDFPVYLYCQDDNQGSECNSSDLALAFLMQLHLIDLWNQNSIYLYGSVKMKNILEKIGMKHIKIDRALANPDLLRFGAVQCTVPKMFQNIEIVPLEFNGQSPVLTPQLPFIKDGPKSLISFDRHRYVYVSAASLAILNRNQERYTENVLPISDSSRIDRHRQARVDSPEVHISHTVQLTNTSNSDKCNIIKVSSASDIVKSRKSLPCWMLSKRSNESSRDYSVRSPKKLRHLIPSTVYVMNERELLLTSRLLLDEAENCDQTEENVKTNCDDANDESHSTCSERNNSTTPIIANDTINQDILHKDHNASDIICNVIEPFKYNIDSVCQEDINLETFLDKFI